MIETDNYHTVSLRWNLKKTKQMNIGKKERENDKPGNKLLKNKLMVMRGGVDGGMGEICPGD